MGNQGPDQLYSGISAFINSVLSLLGLTIDGYPPESLEASQQGDLPNFSGIYGAARRAVSCKRSSESESPSRLKPVNTMRFSALELSSGGFVPRQCA